MEMPDLPPEQKRQEERRVLKFWIDQCHGLEQKVLALKEDVATLESQTLAYQAIIHYWFPEIMASRSEDYFAAGWMVNLDTELVKMDSDIHDAAMLIGEIPTYWDGNSDPSTNATWRIYP